MTIFTYRLGNIHHILTTQPREAHLQQITRKRNYFTHQPGFPLPIDFPPSITLKWFEFTFHHTVTTVKCGLSKRSLLAKWYVVSAVISCTSLSQGKGSPLSLSREEEALHCALHHFRLADETAQLSDLSLRSPAPGDAARKETGGSAPLEEKNKITSGYLPAFVTAR